MVDRTGPVLAIVPAREESKGLPSKIVRSLGGHPLMAYSIASGLAAKTIDRVIVSTDDKRIMEVACSYGADAPFLRPREQTGDTATDLSLFEHALGWLRDHEGYEPSIVVQLQPATPFRPHGFLDEAVRLLQSDIQSDSVRSVTHPKQHPSEMWTRDDGGFLRPLSENSHTKSYDLPSKHLRDIFLQTGHVNVVRTETILKKGSLAGDSVKSILVDSAYVVDVDSLEDLHFAEYLIEKGALDIDLPKLLGSPSLPLSASIRLVVLDFDGTMTDDRVWIDQDGRETVVCSRSDSLGLELLSKAGIEAFVISKEKNSVVARRCQKLGISFRQGVEEKLSELQEILAERKVDARDVIYVGNDVTDLGCMHFVGFSFAPADAHPQVKQLAGRVLTRSGGKGAIRELCEILLDNVNARINE